MESFQLTGPKRIDDEVSSEQTSLAMENLHFEQELVQNRDIFPVSFGSALVVSRPTRSYYIENPTLAIWQKSSVSTENPMNHALNIFKSQLTAGLGILQGSAGSLCRLLKLLAAKHTKSQIFLDSDQLEALGPVKTREHVKPPNPFHGWSWFFH